MAVKKNNPNPNYTGGQGDKQAPKMSEDISGDEPEEIPNQFPAEEKENNPDDLNRKRIDPEIDEDDEDSEIELPEQSENDLEEDDTDTTDQEGDDDRDQKE